jgi:ribosomal protein L28
MANICYHCGKTVLFGRSHTHHRGVAGGRWKKRAPKTRRIFQPNLQKVTILEQGKEKPVKLCAKCIKRIKKDLKEGKKPFLTLATNVLPKKETEKEISSKKPSSKKTKK